MFISRRILRVDWGHCDPAGIVFYPNYFRWFDECTTVLFENAGIPLPQLYRTHRLKGFPLLEAGAKFSGTSTFGDSLDCESSVSEWKEKTLKIRHRFLRGGASMVDGWELRICAIPHPEDPQRIKAAPIPDVVKDRLGGDRIAP